MSDSPGLLRRMDRTGVPLLLARLVLGGMFIYMGVDKIQNQVLFLKLIRQRSSGQHCCRYHVIDVAYAIRISGRLLRFRKPQIPRTCSSQRPVCRECCGYCINNSLH